MDPPLKNYSQGFWKVWLRWRKKKIPNKKDGICQKKGRGKWLLEKSRTFFHYDFIAVWNGGEILEEWIIMGKGTSSENMGKKKNISKEESRLNNCNHLNETLFLTEYGSKYCTAAAIKV